MADIKNNIAKNIAALRTAAKMTQFELAEKLNYSDKAVSKWERGESMPDICILNDIAETFGVSLDFLVKSEHSQRHIKLKHNISSKMRNHGFITGMGILVVWLVATFVFLILNTVCGTAHPYWLTFLFAIPVSMIVWLVLNSVWFNRHRNFLIVSLLMWSTLLCAYVTLITFNYNLWLLFVLGGIGQIIILMWSKITKTPAPQKTGDDGDLV